MSNLCYTEAIVYFWPFSQICMTCKHGESISSQRSFLSQEQMCEIDCKENTCGKCPKIESDGSMSDDDVNRVRNGL